MRNLDYIASFLSVCNIYLTCLIVAQSLFGCPGVHPLFPFPAPLMAHFVNNVIVLYMIPCIFMSVYVYIYFYVYVYLLCIRIIWKFVNTLVIYQTHVILFSFFSSYISMIYFFPFNFFSFFFYVCITKNI